MNNAELLGVALALIVLAAVGASAGWFARRVDRVQQAVKADLAVSAKERDDCREEIEHWKDRFYAERQARNELWAQYQVLTGLVREKLGYEAVKEAAIRSLLVPSREEQMRLVELLLANGVTHAPEWRDSLLRALPAKLVESLIRRSSPRGDLTAIVTGAAEWDPSAFRSLLDQLEEVFGDDEVQGQSYLAAAIRKLRSQWGI